MNITAMPLFYLITEQPDFDFLLVCEALQILLTPTFSSQLPFTYASISFCSLRPIC